MYFPSQYLVLYDYKYEIDRTFWNPNNIQNHYSFNIFILLGRLPRWGTYLCKIFIGTLFSFSPLSTNLRPERTLKIFSSCLCHYYFCNTAGTPCMSNPFMAHKIMLLCPFFGITIWLDVPRHYCLLDIT